MKTIKTYIFLFLIFSASLSNAQQLFINEVMASNTATIMSPLGGYGDWIELYNPTNAAIDLGGMFITDDVTALNKYQFPASTSATIIQPNSYLLVWADDSAQSVHTNFKLTSTSGESVVLVAADGSTILDSISFGPQTTDVSYGRDGDGNPTWVSFITPTPNATNGPTAVKVFNTAPISVDVFPNPATDKISINNIDWKSVEITDIEGRLLLRERNNNRFNSFIDISELPKGILILNLNDAKSITHYKLLKD